MIYKKHQALFYDENPPLIPWPRLLREYGLSRLYKPREIFWKKAFDKLGMNKGDKVLEVGCGQGLFLARLVKHYGVIGTGIDVSSKSIEYARRNYVNDFINYQVADGVKIPFKNNTFDFVVTFDVLEHIEDQKRAVKEMLRVLKPGGRLLIYTLNKDDKYTLDWWWEKMGADIYSRAMHKRELFLDTKWLKRTLKENGTEIIYFEFFDAFFTLFFDEIIMLCVDLSRRINLFKNRKLGIAFLFINHVLSSFVYYIIKVLDYGWFRNGKSLSFIVISQKNIEK